MSRRAMLGSMAIVAAGTLGATAGISLAAESKTGASSGATVRDRLWIFSSAHHGAYNGYLERAKVSGGSRMTPAEGAFWLGVPNLLFIRTGNIPPLPSTETARVKTSFEQYAISFQPLDRVVWSVVGASGVSGMEELPSVLDLAKKFPNISGVYFDDFIHRAEKRADGRMVCVPALQPDELKAARERLNEVGRPLETWVTLYTHTINPLRHGITSPVFKYCDPPLVSFIHQFDVLTLWTWNSDELPYLEENMAALEKIRPQSARIALGLYIFDFHNTKPVPVELMQHQCELGLKWLRAGRIHDMIFLANTLLDVGLPSAEYSRQWIKKVGNIELSQ